MPCALRQGRQCKACRSVKKEADKGGTLREVLVTDLRLQYPEPPKTGKVRVKVKCS